MRGASLLFVHANVMQLRNTELATGRRFLDMWDAQQTKTIDAIRELTLEEVQAVSGGDGPEPICGGPSDPCKPPPDDCAWWNPFC
jgi:hypothetical protein